MKYVKLFEQWKASYKLFEAQESNTNGQEIANKLKISDDDLRFERGAKNLISTINASLEALGMKNKWVAVLENGDVVLSRNPQKEGEFKFNISAGKDADGKTTYASCIIGNQKISNILLAKVRPIGNKEGVDSSLEYNLLQVIASDGNLKTTPYKWAKNLKLTNMISSSDTTKITSEATQAIQQLCQYVADEKSFKSNYAADIEKVAEYKISDVEKFTPAQMIDFMKKFVPVKMLVREVGALSDKLVIKNQSDNKSYVVEIYNGAKNYTKEDFERTIGDEEVISYPNSNDTIAALPVILSEEGSNQIEPRQIFNFAAITYILDTYASSETQKDKDFWAHLKKELDKPLTRANMKIYCQTRLEKFGDWVKSKIRG